MRKKMETGMVWSISVAATDVPQTTVNVIAVVERAQPEVKEAKWANWFLEDGVDGPIRML